MLCMKCGKPVGETSQFCEDCQTAEAVRSQEDAEEREQALEIARTHNFVVRALQILAVLAILVLVIGYFTKPRFVPQTELASNSGYPRALCAYYKNCAVLYVAPWCSACKRVIEPTARLEALMNRYSNIGFEIIVGLSSKNKLEAFAAKFGSNVLLDEEGVFYKAAGVSSVPKFFSVNSKGKVLGKSYFPRGGSVEAQAETLIDNLNLEK